MRELGRPPATGFTIVELLIVVAMVAIIGAVATPAYVDWRADSRNRNVVALIEQSLSQARQTAKRLSEDIVVNFADDSNQFTVGAEVKTLPSGTRISTSTPSGESVGFSGILGVQSPFEAVSVDIVTGTGIFRRSVQLTILPPLAKTVVAR